jgi:transposase InsO family protein
MAFVATLGRLRRSVFFPGMSTEVKGFVETCLSCQTKKRKRGDQRHTLVSPLSGYPFQKIHLDFVGPLSQGRRTGARWLLTVRDSFSKWVEAIPLVSATAESAVAALEKEIFSRYGLPEAIHTDCGKQFGSRLFKGVGELLQIQITDTTGYNPKGNGQVERMHRDLGEILRALLRDDPDSWEDALPQALFAMRTSVCSSTGLPPYQILFGRDVSQPLDIIFKNPNEGPIEGSCDYHHYVRKLRTRIDRAQEFVRKNLSGEVRRQRRQYHQERRCFLAGARVWLFTPVSLPGMPRKLSSYWTGPWIVAATPVNQVMVRIYPDPNWKNVTESKVVSMDRLKPYRSSRTQPPVEGDDLAMEGDEFAENIYDPHFVAANPLIGLAPVPMGGVGPAPAPAPPGPGGPGGGGANPPGGPQGPGGGGDNPPGGPRGPNQPPGTPPGPYGLPLGFPPDLLDQGGDAGLGDAMGPPAAPPTTKKGAGRPKGKGSTGAKAKSATVAKRPVGRPPKQKHQLSPGRDERVGRTPPTATRRAGRGDLVPVVAREATRDRVDQPEPGTSGVQAEHGSSPGAQAGPDHEETPATRPTRTGVTPARFTDYVSNYRSSGESSSSEGAADAGDSTYKPPRGSLR